MIPPSRRRASLTKRLALSALSAAFCIGLIGIGELLCRSFLDINLRKTSREFLKRDASGAVIGNVSNGVGTSFGVEVYSDENGFRVPKGYVHTPKKDQILLLGDSVLFGVGIPEERTFAGRLRSSLQDTEILNSGVVGYSLGDYKRVSAELIPRYPKIGHVYLFYCLNDFQPGIIDPADQPQPASGAWPAFKRSVWALFASINDTLGAHSKLFVFITGETADPSRRYWEWDRSLMNVDDDTVARTLQPVVEIDGLTKEHGADLTVYFLPYEKQLRDGPAADWSPQDRVEAVLRQHGIRYFDARNDFAGLPHSTDAYLFADPMHLNEKGHEIVFNALMRQPR